MTAASTAAPEGSRLRGAASRRRNEGVIRMVLLAAAVVSILISVGIVLSLVFEAISFLVADRPVAALRCRLVPATRPVLHRDASSPAR